MGTQAGIASPSVGITAAPCSVSLATCFILPKTCDTSVCGFTPMIHLALLFIIFLLEHAWF